MDLLKLARRSVGEHMFGRYRIFRVKTQWSYGLRLPDHTSRVEGKCRPLETGRMEIACSPACGGFVGETLLGQPGELTSKEEKWNVGEVKSCFVSGVQIPNV